MKKAYKELKKKLKNKYIKKNNGVNYEVSASVGYWVAQCDMKPTEKHTQIVCKIFGSIPYPYVEQDRVVVLKYLNKHKYKEFKNEKIK